MKFYIICIHVIGSPQTQFCVILTSLRGVIAFLKILFLFSDAFFQIRGQIWVCLHGPIFMKFCMIVIHVILSPQTKFHVIWTSFRGVQAFLLSFFFSISHASIGF